MFQHERGYPSPTDSLPSIQINDEELNAVNNFKYLGSTVSSNASLDMEIQSRISAAATAYNKLSKRIFYPTQRLRFTMPSSYLHFSVVVRHGLPIGSISNNWKHTTSDV